MSSPSPTLCLQVLNAAAFPARASMAAVATPYGVLVFGGADMEQRFYDDCWLLELGGAGDRCGGGATAFGGWVGGVAGEYGQERGCCYLGGAGGSCGKIVLLSGRKDLLLVSLLSSALRGCSAHPQV